MKLKKLDNITISIGKLGEPQTRVPLNVPAYALPGFDEIVLHRIEGTRDWTLTHRKTGLQCIPRWGDVKTNKASMLAYLGILAQQGAKAWGFNDSNSPEAIPVIQASAKALREFLDAPFTPQALAK